MTSTSRSLAVLIFGYLLLAIESPLLRELHLAYFAPDLALVVVVWAALHMNPTSGAMTAFALGYLKDGFVMGTPIGMHMEIFVVIFFLVRAFVGKIQLRSVWVLVITSGMAALLAAVLFLLLSLLFDPTFGSYALVLRLMVPVALVTAPFAPIVFYGLDRIGGLFLSKGRDTLFG